MKTVEITEVENGFKLKLDGRLEYVFKALEEKEVLEKLGKFLFDRKVKVDLN